MIVEADFSRNHTNGQVARENQNIAGDKVKQTHSLLRKANSLGTNSPTTIVAIVSGATNKAIATPSANRSFKPYETSIGERSSEATAPPVAPATKPTTVIPNWTTAKLFSIPSFISIAAEAPHRPDSCNDCNRAKVTLANAIS